ncbi:General secretion pathway protein D [hydrothermal vent metagenome]|uniref:General secretion pathway protein D n=1 Tax=hydrothermal vent metagenome TaxID=652676 RepID=A0A3B1CFG0_9ZZZZ
MRKSIGSFAVPLFTVFLMLGATSLGYSANTGKITLNFQETDIKAVVQAIGKMTGKTFLLDPRVKGTVDIISSSPVSTSIVYDILITTLRLHGFTAIETNGVTKIVPEALAKHYGGPVVKNRTSLRWAPIKGQDMEPTIEPYNGTGKTGMAGDRIITQVYPLTHVSAKEVLSTIKPLVGPTSVAMAFQSSNTLLITDYASNIKRLDEVIANLDIPEQGEVEVIALKHIYPVDFIEIFEKLYLNRPAGTPPTPQGMSAGSGVVGRFSVIPDMRTNSIIVRSNNEYMSARIHELLGKIDVPSARKDNIRLVKIQHADVKKVAEALNKLIPKTKFKNGKTLPVVVHADVESKSLIISAPEAIYRSLRGVISELDVRRKQVFLEALIAEVTSDKVSAFGIQWQSLRGFEANRAPGMTAVGGVNLGPTGSEIGNAGASLTSGSPPGGFTVGLINGAITLADGTVIPNLMALASALETDTDANILSTPTLLTLDNEVGKIIVGQNVPFLTGSYAPSTGGTTNTVNPFQTIERKDIGLKLTIKPVISDTGTIKLEIFEEVSSLLPFTVQTGTVDIVVNKRSLESTVLVNDGQIIVLGGLIKDNVSLSEERVPFFGSIPIIGNLFRHETRQYRKTNLMVFIRPYIIKDVNDSDRFTEKAYNYTIGEQGEVKADPHLLLLDVPTPTLPELDMHDKNGKPAPEVPTSGKSMTEPPPAKAPGPKKSETITQEQKKEPLAKTKEPAQTKKKGLFSWFKSDKKAEPATTPEKTGPATEKPKQIEFEVTEGDWEF